MLQRSADHLSEDPLALPDHASSHSRTERQSACTQTMLRLPTAVVAQVARKRRSEHRPCHNGDHPWRMRADILHELIVATRILANENVLDAFGHVSVRHPGDPEALFHLAPPRAGIGRSVRPGRAQSRIRSRSSRPNSGSTASASSTAKSTRRGRTSMPCAIITRTRCCPTAFPDRRSCRSSTSAP